MTIRRRTMTGTAGYGLTGVAAVAAVAALAAGCSSASSSSSSSAPASGPSTPAASATPAASSTAGAPTASPPSPSGTSGTAAGGPPACPTRSLKVTTGTAQGTAGSVYQAIDFTNTSNAACTLYGYPGVALAGGSPVKQIGAAATRSTQTAARLVTLGPGQTANAVLRVTDALNYPKSTCDPVTSAYLQIYPPNQTTRIYLHYKTLACSSPSVKQLSVSVVQPGSGS